MRDETDLSLQQKVLLRIDDLHRRITTIMNILCTVINSNTANFVFYGELVLLDRKGNACTEDL